MMSDDTKMIIITSNSEIIQQFQTNENLQTQIIDLDDGDDQNRFNLAFLAQLFNPQNCRNDQNVKRALDCDRDDESKGSKSMKKCNEKMCAICGDYAIGYNYDVLSCTSCKAFFYRNANQDFTKVRCLRGDDRCIISHEIRRKCRKCRLTKCFSVGMRKDFLLSEKEKQRRKNLIEQKRNSSAIDRFYFDFFEDQFSIEDWILIENLQSTFVSVFQTDFTKTHVENVNNHISALIYWSHIVESVVMNFIEYFRRIEHFERLNNDDRFILIKYNVSCLYPILKAYYFHPIFNSFDSQNDEETKKAIEFYNLCFDPNTIDLSSTYAQLVLLFVETTKQDPILIGLIFIILLFSQRILTNENEQSFNDPSTIFQIQCYYTEILWKYLVNKQGELESIRTWNNLLRGIFQTKSLAKIAVDYFNEQMSANSADQLAPLFQTILHIS